LRPVKARSERTMQTCSYSCMLNMYIWISCRC